MTTAPPSTETHGRPPYKRLLKHERIVKDLLIGFIVPQRAPGWAGALDFDSLHEGPTEEITDTDAAACTRCTW